MTITDNAFLLLAIDQLFELTIQADLNEGECDDLLDFLNENDVGVPLATLIKLDFISQDLQPNAKDAIMESWREANDLGLLDKYLPEGD